MLKFKIDCKESFITEYDDYKYFPFDAPKFKLKFELLHLHFSD